METKAKLTYNNSIFTPHKPTNVKHGHLPKGYSAKSPPGEKRSEKRKEQHQSNTISRARRLNFYTAKLPKFFSRFWNPSTSGVDFFAQNLEPENCLVVPPVSLVARAVHYLSLHKARATIVVPVWRSPSFWPLITSKY